MTNEPKTNFPLFDLRGLAPWLVAIAAAWLIQMFGVPFMDPYFFTIVIYAGINMTLAVSLNLVNGFTGQFSMGHAGFMAVGAYMSAFLTLAARASWPDIFANPVSQQLIFVGALIAGGLAASIAGYIVGLPSLRLKGDYLAIVTLGFGEIIRVVLLNMNAVGGARGMPAIPMLTNFGWVYSLAVVCTFVVWRLVHSAYGRDLLAVREDEVAAQAMGVNTTYAKVRAFTIGAFFAGVGGGLFAHYLTFLNPAIFDFNRSFEIIIMVVLGGMGSLSGSILAAILLTGLREVLRDVNELRMIVYSLLLIIMMLIRPNGFLGTREIFSYLPAKLRERLGFAGPNT